MTKPTHQKFKVKHLGVINSGEFEHKPLTIFCGPNNSGKTWTMYSLYHFYTLAHDVVIDFSEIKPLLKESSEFDIADWVNQNYEKIIHRHKHVLSEALPDFFNCPSEILETASFTSLIGVKEMIERISKAALTVRGPRIVIEKQKNSTKVQISNEGAPKDIKEIFLSRFLTKCLFKYSDTFLVPAERNGLHLFYKELSNKRTALLHHASKENINIPELLHDVMQSRYAKPIANYIDWLNGLTEYQKNKSEFYLHAKNLEKNLAGGVYKIDKNTGTISFKPYQIRGDSRKTQAMGLHMTSSTVKSLLGLWFYLKHQAKKGDVLMIDEPELNIHPENQIKLARLLAQLVNAGLQVVISTHSDYMIREFNTLIMLNQDNMLQIKHGYEPDEAIDYKKVGAYLFDKQKITPFDITPDDGIYATTFDEVTKDINKVNDDIYYALKEHDE